jgi:hypothetical protein
MKSFLAISILILILIVLLISQSCLNDPVSNPDSVTGEFEFSIIPAEPTTADEVKLITYDCKYNVLASITTKGKDITVKKRFNSQMKWPCVLRYDTISLGKLKQGNYSVILLIIDTNPSVTDSISMIETIAVKVLK